MEIQKFFCSKIVCFHSTENCRMALLLHMGTFPISTKETNISILFVHKWHSTLFSIVAQKERVRPAQKGPFQLCISNWLPICKILNKKIDFSFLSNISISINCGALFRNERYGKLEHLWHKNFDFSPKNVELR